MPADIPNVEDASQAAVVGVAVTDSSDDTADLEKYRIEVEHLREQLDAMYRQNETLHARLAQAEQDIATHIASETQHRIEVDRLKEELDVSQRELATAKSRLNLVRWANGNHQEVVPAECAEISLACARKMDMLLRRLFTDGGSEQQNAIEILKRMIENNGIDIYTIALDWAASRVKWNQEIVGLYAVIRKLRNAAASAAVPTLRRRRS